LLLKSRLLASTFSATPSKGRALSLALPFVRRYSGRYFLQGLARLDFAGGVEGSHNQLLVRFDNPIEFAAALQIVKKLGFDKVLSNGSLLTLSTGDSSITIRNIDPVRFSAEIDAIKGGIGIYFQHEAMLHDLSNALTSQNLERANSIELLHAPPVDLDLAAKLTIQGRVAAAESGLSRGNRFAEMERLTLASTPSSRQESLEIAKDFLSHLASLAQHESADSLKSLCTSPLFSGALRPAGIDSNKMISCYRRLAAEHSKPSTATLWMAAAIQASSNGSVPLGNSFTRHRQFAVRATTLARQLIRKRYQVSV